MGTKLPEKVEGAKTTCFCNTIIICRLKPASGEYEAKLQWQNVDGGAHFSYDSNTKKSTCNKPGGDGIPPEQYTSKKIPQQSIMENIPENELKNKVIQAERVYREVLGRAYEVAKSLNPNQDAYKLQIVQLCVAKSLVFLLKQ